MIACGKIHIQLVSCFSLFSSVAILWDLAVFTYSFKKKTNSIRQKMPTLQNFRKIKNHFLIKIWNEIVYEVFKEVNFLLENVLVNLLKHFLKSFFGINKFYPSLTGKVFKIYKWGKKLKKNLLLLSLSLVWRWLSVYSK